MIYPVDHAVEEYVFNIFCPKTAELVSESASLSVQQTVGQSSRSSPFFSGKNTSNSFYGNGRKIPEFVDNWRQLTSD